MGDLSEQSHNFKYHIEYSHHGLCCIQVQKWETKKKEK